jgi:hypothetical protein
MKDENIALKNLLQRHEVPNASEQVRERARHRALVALGQASCSAQEHEVVIKAGSWVNPAAWVYIAIGLGLSLAWWGLRLNEAGHHVHLLAEMEQLFPGQVLAVIEGEDGVDVQLLEEMQTTPTPMDQEVCMVVERHGMKKRIYTFSGREVCLHMDGAKICLTGLISVQDGVLVMTNDALIRDAGKLSNDFKVVVEPILSGRESS